MTAREPWLVTRTFVDEDDRIVVTEVIDLYHPKCPFVVFPPSDRKTYTRESYLSPAQYRAIFGEFAKVLK